MKRVDIKTGFRCNNNCRFCVQADQKYQGNRPGHNIRKEMEECRPTCEGVVLTGGEVTIRDDFLEIVNYASELGYSTIQMQTNGRMFASMDFCKKTIAAGANEFAPALHGYCANQHEYLTRAPESFRQTIQGIRNLRSLGMRVITNTVVTKPNMSDIPRIATLLARLGVDQFQFAFVHPMGNAWQNFTNIVPSISLTAPYLKRGLQIGNQNGIQTMAEAMPYCQMGNLTSFVAEEKIPDTKIRGAEGQETEDYTSTRTVEGKKKFPQCRQCLYNSLCEGPWKEYPLMMGSTEFNPIRQDTSR